MTKQKRQKMDRAYYTFGLLMLSVVLVFVFGVMVGKQNLPANTETVHKNNMHADSENPTESTAPTETQPVQVSTPQESQAQPVPEYEEATDFWCLYPHIYLRINHEKQLELDAVAEFDLSDACYGVSDASILAIDDSGHITGLTKGECDIIVSCHEETLHIPVTVRELTVRDGMTYVDDILVVNKTYGLPESYDPGMLPETEAAFDALQEEADRLGLDIYMGSGYRDYEFQVDVYESMREGYGEAYAQTLSAKPGHSEHQSGYAIDCNTIDDKFDGTDEGKWLEHHCHEYGFIIRYPQGKEDITGYDYESWHIRYVGVEAATEIFEQGLCLEEYLDVESIHPEDAENPEDTGNAENSSDSSDSENAWNPDNSWNAGNPDNSSDSGDAWSPDNSGNPGNAGNSGNAGNPEEFIDAPLQAPV